MSELKSVLVTGGAGYIGSHTVIALIEQGFNPIIIDDLRNAKEDVVPRVEEITGKKILHFPIACQDKAAVDKIVKEHPIWGVIHFAADKAVGESVENPLKYFDNNLGGLVALLEVLKDNGVSRLVFSSSCTVYGIAKSIPVDESNPVSYNSPYGFTKLVNEQMLEQFNAAHPEFKMVLLRYFNPVGAHPSTIIGEEPQGVPSNLLPFLTQTAAGIRPVLTVYGDDYDTPDGTCIRDYIHVSDLAEAHVAALEYMEKEDSPSFDVINIGTGKGTSVKEMIDCFEENCGTKLNWQVGPRRPGDVPAIYADATRAEEKLGWKARFSVKDAVTSAWNYQQKRLEKLKSNS